jgi:hypothetical protein
LKIEKKELKKIITVAKRIVDKKDGKMLIHCDGDSVKMQCGNPNIIANFKIENKDTDSFIILLDPRELEELIKPKQNEFEFILKGSKLVEIASGKGINKRDFNREIDFNFEETVPFENPELFINVLKDVEKLFCDTELEVTQFLQLNPHGALALEPKRIHYYRFEEKFGFKELFFHADVVKILTKTLKGTFSHGMYKDALLLEHDGVFYILNSKKKMYVPDLRKIKREQSGCSFVVNAKEMNDAMKDYKKKCKQLYFSVEGNDLVIDAKEEEFQTQRVNIQSIKGEFQPSIFETETIKGLLASYGENVTIQHQKFMSINGDEGYMWWSYEPHKIIMAAGITEPDHQKEWEKVMAKRKESK